MYIQITDHCNMSCIHCCYSCGPRKKNFMSMSLFKAAIDFSDGDESVAIGGGEPTLHPDFWAFIGLGLGSWRHVWLATNGSQTDTTLRLAKMAKRGILGCALSWGDGFHDRIDARVVEAFSGCRHFGHQGSENDLREVRNVAGKVFRSGRAKRTGVWNEEGCCCEDIFVDPNGNIWSCGCKKLLLGHVLSGWNAVGERHASRYQHDRWSEIDDFQCLFTNQTSEVESYLMWLKEG